MGAGMIDLRKIETAVRAQRSSWHTLFRREGAGWQCILFPRHRLTEQDYRTLARRLSAPELTPEECKRNAIRARADEADKHGR